MSQYQEGLDACVAVVIAFDDAGRATLSELGKRVGFGVVADQSKSYTMLPSCLPFFLLHFGLGDSAKIHLISKIRHSANKDIRFAPIILFIPDGPAHRAVHFIDMGFDDVIRLPEKSDVVAKRLGLQLGRECIFIEADHYLGPDRRRMEVIERDTMRRKRGGSDHDRLTIVRIPGEGVSILDRRHVSCGGNPLGRAG